MKDSITVMHSDGSSEEFKASIIKKTIMKETDVDEELAEKIKNNIVKKIYKLQKNDDLKTISTSTIRAEVSHYLLHHAEFDAETQNRKLGMSITELENLLENHDKSNANIQDSPEAIVKYSSDSILKEYALLKLPTEISKAYTDGYIHLHDLESFFTRPNCFNYNIEFFAKNGLSCDGERKTTSTAGPSKSLSVLFQHLEQAMMSGSSVLSGGQSFSNFNTKIVNYSKNLTYTQLKQNLQNFLFSCNMSCVAKSQVIFSSVSLDLDIPSYLKDVPAIAPGGTTDGVYGDYADEVKRILKIFVELLKEGDKDGRPLRFPNTLFNLRDEYMDSVDDELYIICDYLKKFPTGYFINDDMEGAGETSACMGCRTRMATNYTGDWEKDTLNTGNFAFHTLNLPLMALDSNKDIDEFYKILDKYLVITKDSLLYRFNIIDKRLKDDRLPFLTQKDKVTGEPLYDINRTSLTFGFCGLNECVEELIGEPIESENGKKLGTEILEHINEYSKKCKEETGKRFGVFATPAESTATRFAMINKEKYPNAIVNGDEGAYYLTNSSHINVQSDATILQHIQNADNFHKLEGAGAILHLWLSQIPTTGALVKLTKEIKQTNTGFWAYTLDFSICNSCGQTYSIAVDECSNCHSKDITTYSRITGYYLPVNTYGQGKAKEWSQRHRHNLNELN